MDIIQQDIVGAGASGMKEVDSIKKSCQGGYGQQDLQFP
jgi:hypothetical protein